jgi:hypothetical protein
MIDAAFKENNDPLTAAREEKDFEKLFTRIVTLAPPPIGVGPAADAGDASEEGRRGR